jgi:hypothetical protein
MVDFKLVWCFTLCSLAVWRIAHLFTNENGPWNLVLRLRLALGFEGSSHPMACFYGLSLLVALPPALWLSSDRMEFFMQWMAISAVACLLEKATEKIYGKLHLYPLPAVYLDKVIRGV